MDSPFWNALAAESTLASGQVRSGAIGLSALDPINPGSFYSAFFPLSIGYERMAKIAVQVDARLETGAFMSEQEMRKIGNQISHLFELVEEIANRRGYASKSYSSRPTEPVHNAIVAILSEFATKGRYNHLDSLGATGHLPRNAEHQWDAEVMSSIAERHLTEHAKQKIIGSSAGLGAAIADAAEGTDIGFVFRRRDVDGTLHTSPAPIAMRSLLYKTLIPWSRLYTLQMGRWLATILIELGRDARTPTPSPEIPYFGDFFQWLTAEDSFLKTRKDLGRI